MPWQPLVLALASLRRSTRFRFQAGAAPCSTTLSARCLRAPQPLYSLEQSYQRRQLLSTTGALAPAVLLVQHLWASGTWYHGSSLAQRTRAVSAVRHGVLDHTLAGVAHRQMGAALASPDG